MSFLPKYNTPPNPLVSKKEETQRRKPRLNTQARLITSDEQIRQYEEKVEKIRKKKKEGKKCRKKERQCKKEDQLAAVAQRAGLRTRGGTKASLGRVRGIKTRGGKQWHQSVKSLESGLSEEESEVAAANIITDVSNVTAPLCPVCTVSLHRVSKNYGITQKVKKKHLAQHQILQMKIGNAKNVEKMMVMLAIILVALIAIDGSMKDARRSQTKISILSVIYVNLRKVV